MDPTSAFGFEACRADIVCNMAKALAERHGETPQQQYVRLQAAIHMIMGFLPRDVVETVLASHCVMFHELMADSLHDAFCAPAGKVRRTAVYNVLAQNKAFSSNLKELRYYQARPAEGSRERSIGVRPAAAGAQPVAPAVTVPPAAPDAPAAASQEPGGAQADPAMFADHPSSRPTAEAIAACQANPAAAAALEAGDAAGFAKAVGVEPTAAFLAAAGAEGSPFDPKASGPWPDDAWPDRPKT